MSSPHLAHRRPHILIIDDEENALRLLQKSLSQTYRCDTTNCAQQALTLMQRRRFQIVIINVSLPEAKGFWLLSEVKEKFPSSIILTISKMFDRGHSAEALSRGAYDHITKPFSLHEVKKVVERGLQQQVAKTNHSSLPPMPKEPVKASQMTWNVSSPSGPHRFGSFLSQSQGLAEILNIVMEMCDTETRWHSQRVVSYCLRLGKEFGLSSKEMKGLENGALLHDIGKSGVPSYILFKSGPLTDEEWIEMRRHVEYGAEILRRIKPLENGIPVVLQHHEKWDGSGYPLGLKGEEITLNARIFAVADAFDAITSDRPYRAGNTFDAAIAELKMGAGTHFDPQVVEVFLSISLDEWQAIRAARKDMIYSLNGDSTIQTSLSPVPQNTVRHTY